MRSALQPRLPQKLYPFDRGRRILRYILETLTARFYKVGEWWIDKAKQLVKIASHRHWFVQYWIYLCVVGMLIFAVVQCAEMLIVVILLLILHTLILGIWALIYTLIISFFSICTWMYTKYNAFFFCCPHCHKEMPLPTFRCSCGSE